MTKIYAILIVSFILPACSSTPEKSYANLHSLVLYTSTRSDVVTMLGEPLYTKEHQDGRVVLIYQTDSNETSGLLFTSDGILIMIVVFAKSAQERSISDTSG